MNYKILEQLKPYHMTERERVEMTCSCHDSDIIPKIKLAGQVFINSDNQSIQLMHNGLKVLEGGYYGNMTTEIIQRCRGHHEPQEELVFHEILKHIPKKATMLELGGYWVYYSMWFLNDYADYRTAYAIEPDPEHIRIGLYNCHLNQLNVYFTQGFIGNTHGDFQSFNTEKSGHIVMPSITVPGFMNDYHLDYIDLILCDIQGAELTFIEQIQELIKTNRLGFILVSTHADLISSDPLMHQRCLEMLTELGGQILAEHDVHESFSGDGLIAVKFGEKLANWKIPPLSRNRYSTSHFRNPLYDLAVMKSQLEQLRSCIQEPLFNQHYIVHTSLPFIELIGFGCPELSTGIWTDGTSATFILFASQTLIDTHSTGNISFLVTPFLGKDLATQAISFHYGKNSQYRDDISSEQWISLPYTVHDWEHSAEKKLMKIAIQISVPGAVSPRQLDLGEDIRLLGLRFLKVSLSDKT